MEPERRSDPSPDPKASPQASPESETRAQSSPSDAPFRPGSEPYIPLPAAPPVKKSRWGLIAAAALLAAAAGVGLKLHKAAAPAPPGAAAPGEAVIVVAPGDRDAAATALARQLLAQLKGTGELEATAAKLKAERQPGAASAAAAVQTPKALSPEQAKLEQRRQVLEALALSPEPVRQAVVDGSAGFYTFRFVDPDGLGGDVFDVAVDGSNIARVVTGPQEATLTIPLDPRVSHHITETLVFARDRRVYVRTGGGADNGPVYQAHLSVANSAGDYRSKTMGPGDSQTWSVRMGGGAGAPASGN